MIAILLVIALTLPSNLVPEGRNSVDLIELNHNYDRNGCPVFDQVILWDLDPASGKYHVRAWVLCEPYPVMINGVWVFRHQGACVRSRMYRESWTQFDPERADQRFLHESERIKLNDRTTIRKP